MGVDEEIEVLENIISNIESAISEVRHCDYFEDKISCWEDDLKELNDRLVELQAIQSEEWQQEMDWQQREYYKGVM